MVLFSEEHRTSVASSCTSTVSTPLSAPTGTGPNVWDSFEIIVENDEAVQYGGDESVGERSESEERIPKK